MDPSEASQIVAQNYIDIAAMVVLYYDHAMTLDDEVRYVWFQRKFTGSWIFLLNRYLAFFSTLTWIPRFLNWTSQSGFVPGIRLSPPLLINVWSSCSQYNTYRQLIVGIIELVVAINMFLRVYGLYGKDKRVLFLVLSMAVPLSAICAWNFASENSSNILTGGCHVAFTPGTYSGVRLAMTWESILAYDILIFTLTSIKTFTAIRRYQAHHTWGLAALLFRDGAMYYAIITCACLANVLTFYLLPPVLMGSLSTIAGSISVTMVSRTMLNLYRTAALDRSITRTMGTDDALSTVVFLTTRADIPDPIPPNRHAQDAGAIGDTDLVIAPVASNAPLSSLA